ncbi:MAG: NAD(P)-dependent dehydrogenase (short-subunit alcohol dehydrogenase family) [Halioglobus sp.]|jgi:NAD(P)-dependent dehydrogenase (short-subunit alcohol dehydrogenase family)
MNVKYTPENYSPSADLLTGKVIMVTGAGDGIGRTAALTYAQHGATVLLLGRTESKLEAVYDEIEAADGAKPGIIEMDLATAPEDSYKNLAENLAEEFTCVDGLLHNAAMLGDRRPIESAQYDRWQEVMQVNVNAQFILTRSMLPLLQQSKDAAIIFTASSVGRTGKAFWGSYAVSKFATEGLMQVLAEELENTSNIRVNSLNPRATNTAMRRAAYPAETPTDNPSPADIMAPYLYLMGIDSDGITGQAFDAR